MKTQSPILNQAAALEEIQRMKEARSPLIQDFREHLMIKHEGLGYSGAHKGRSAAWLWEKRLNRYGPPRTMADRSSGTWAVENSKVASLCGTKSTFVTVGEPHPIVRQAVEANNGKFMIVKTNAERRSALQRLIATGAWCPDQHNNPEVITAFQETLGREAAEDLQRADVTLEQLRFVVAAVGTGGSAAGLAMGLNDAGYTGFEVVGCDSTSSIVGGSANSSAPFGLTVPGVGSADEVCRTFREAQKVFTRPLVRISPLLAAEAAAEFGEFTPCGCGMSSGVALAAAGLLVNELRHGERILVLFADDAARYAHQLEQISL